MAATATVSSPYKHGEDKKPPAQRGRIKEVIPMYYTFYGYVGIVDGVKMLFATEAEYLDYIS